MKVFFNLDTGICLNTENPEKDLKQCLLQQITAINSLTTPLPEDCITIESGMHEAIHVTTQRKTNCEKFMFIPKGKVLILDINIPEMLLRNFTKMVNEGSIRIGHNRSLGCGLCHIPSQDEFYGRIFTRYTLKTYITNGVFVQGGFKREDDSIYNNKYYSNSAPAKDFYNRISVPASTIKGAVSAQCKRLAEYFHVEDNVLDYMFGNRDKGINACVIFYDAIIENAKEEKVFRRHVDKLTGGVFGDGTGYLQEIYQSGKLNICWDVIPAQDGIDTTIIHKLLLCVCQDIQQKRLSFGRGRGIGRGFIDVQCLTIALPNQEKNKEITIDYENNQINDSLGWISRHWNIKKSMVLLFVIDCSGSMYGSKIGTVNTAIEEVIPKLKDISESNADAQIKIATLQFSTGARWNEKSPVPAEVFRWNYLEANGMTNLGEACHQLNDKLSRNAFMSDATGSFAPVIFLLSDGEPTDNYRQSLEKLKKNDWFKKAIKVAVAIGDDANANVLAEFTGNVEAVITVHSLEALKKWIQFLTVRASEIGSKSLSGGSDNDGAENGTTEEEAKQQELMNAINLKKEEVKKSENSWDSDEEQ